MIDLHLIICLASIAFSVLAVIISSFGIILSVRNMRKDIEELQNRLQNDFMTYNAWRETITEMQNKIKELTNKQNF